MWVHAPEGFLSLNVRVSPVISWTTFRILLASASCHTVVLSQSMLPPMPVHTSEEFLLHALRISPEISCTTLRFLLASACYNIEVLSNCMKTPILVHTPEDFLLPIVWISPVISCTILHFLLVFACDHKEVLIRYIIELLMLGRSSILLALYYLNLSDSIILLPWNYFVCWKSKHIVRHC